MKGTFGHLLPLSLEVLLLEDKAQVVFISLIKAKNMAV